MRVLIVDDSAIMRVLLERVVTAVGMGEIDFVGNGAEALRCFKQHGHDLIILDQTMPKMSGTDFLIQLRDHPALAKAHVMMVTGDANEQLVATIRKERLKIDDLIVKPFDVRKLSRKIADFVAKTGGQSRPDGPLLKPADPAPKSAQNQATLDCAVIDRGGVALLGLKGQFTQENVAIVNAAVKEIQLIHARTIIIDLHEVDTIDDAGMGLIMVINGLLAARDRQCFISFGDCPLKERLIALGVTEIVPVRERPDDPFDTDADLRLTAGRSGS